MTLQDFVNDNFEWDDEDAPLKKEFVQMQLLAQIVKDTEMNNKSEIMSPKNNENDTSVAALLNLRSLSDSPMKNEFDTTPNIRGSKYQQNGSFSISVRQKKGAPTRSFSSHKLLSEKYM